MRKIKITADTRRNIMEDLLKRSPASYGQYEDKVKAIVEDVRIRGDEALFEYARKFDGVTLTVDNIEVTESEIEEAYSLVDQKLLEVIRKALKSITSYHEKQKQNSWMTVEEGKILGQRVTPVARAGVYVPGGKAVYPSSVLMNVLPAKVAGVDRIVMCTPPGKDGK